MKTIVDATNFFKKESLYEALAFARTGSSRFIVRARNLATGVECLFFMNLQTSSLIKQ